jgi:DNA-binding NarL/FixJ family response regulator
LHRRESSTTNRVGVMPRILIVDDNVMFRHSLKDIISRRFPAVLLEEAGNAGEAVEKVRSSPPDIIFMDIKLPGENGLQATKKINEMCPSAEVIIITNHDLPEYRDAARQSGARLFLSKGSTSTEEILGIVFSILSRGS